MKDHFDSLSLLEPVPQGRNPGIYYGFAQTPLGRCLIGLGEDAGHVCYLAFAPPGSDSNLLADLAARWPAAPLHHDAPRAGATVALIFNRQGAADAVCQLRVRGTDFQLAVWRVLLGIPYGTVCTYAEVAERVGRPRASRAVGSAIGANPIAWLIPCHRVIRSDGQLGGYRWGTTMKGICLDYEQSVSSRDA